MTVDQVTEGWEVAKEFVQLVYETAIGIIDRLASVDPQVYVDTFGTLSSEA